jgi:hypothetical protein
MIKLRLFFFSPILGYAEECVKGHNAGYFQPPIYFVASFSFSAEFERLTHKDMATQMEAMHV